MNANSSRARLFKLVSLFLVLGLAACATDTTTDEGTQTASVSGTWKGTVNATGGGENSSFPQILVLTQTGTNVTGSADYDPPDPDDQGHLTGTVSGSTFTFHVTYASTPGIDDCGNYPVDGVATVIGTTMTIKSGTATDCEGDGHGGHTSLTPYTFTGGTLTKQ